MFPFLLEIGSFKIQSYGFFIALGYLAALLLSRHLARKADLPAASFSDLCFLLLVLGLIGSRVLFVLTNLSYFRENPLEILFFWSGGMVFYGGFLLAFAGCLIYLKRKKLPLFQSLDVLAPGLALGHAIGRIGCFAAGCCHGSYCPYPWGIHFHTSLVDPALRGQPMHPTQLYESFCLGLLALGLYFMGKRKARPGLVAALYLCGYSVIRVVIELFRGDVVRGFLPGTAISTSQAIALGLFIGGCVLLIGSFRGVRRNH